MCDCLIAMSVLCIHASLILYREIRKKNFIYTTTYKVEYEQTTMNSQARLCVPTSFVQLRMHTLISPNTSLRNMRRNQLYLSHPRANTA